MARAAVSRRAQSRARAPGPKRCFGAAICGVHPHSSSKLRVFLLLLGAKAGASTRPLQFTRDSDPDEDPHCCTHPLCHTVFRELPPDTMDLTSLADQPYGVCLVGLVLVATAAVSCGLLWSCFVCYRSLWDPVYCCFLVSGEARVVHSAPLVRVGPGHRTHRTAQSRSLSDLPLVTRAANTVKRDPSACAREPTISHPCNLCSSPLHSACAWTTRLVCLRTRAHDRITLRGVNNEPTRAERRYAAPPTPCARPKCDTEEHRGATSVAASHLRRCTRIASTVTPSATGG